MTFGPPPTETMAPRIHTLADYRDDDAAPAHQWPAQPKAAPREQQCWAGAECDAWQQQEPAPLYADAADLAARRARLLPVLLAALMMTSVMSFSVGLSLAAG